MNCRKCQVDNPTGMSFCGHCGTSLFDTHPDFESQPEPAMSRFNPDPERKHITALFMYISGNSAMTEKLDLEQVKEIAEQIFTSVKQIVAKYDGFIEPIKGDGFLAFFSVPRSHEHDPVRAICAAKEIHDFVNSMSPEFQEKFGVSLAMRSGITTGLVLTADVDPEKRALDVAGDTVNLASNLSCLASPGEILVGYDTRVFAADFLEFEDLGHRKVSGQSTGIRILRVLNRKGPQQTACFYRQVKSEMVGRDEELSRLEFQVVKAIMGQGSVVNVVGEAGIGKSRLIAELKKREVMKRVTTLEGRAISIGRNLSFHPVIDLLKNWARIAEGDSEIARLDKLERAIRAIYPEETTEIFPFVATLMGMKLSGRYAERVMGIEGEALERLIFKNVKELLIKEAQLRPTVIVLEDIHWADASSISLLESLYPLAEKYRIDFINVFRPGYIEKDYGSIAKLRQEHHVPQLLIDIQPLNGEKSETLVDNMLAASNFPHALKHKIIMRAGGNPFFIEEIVRSLIDEGAVVRKDGGFEVTEKIDRVVIPSTIKGVLTTRIDRLDERTRELVKIAAVIGKSFFDRVVKDVADSIADIDDRLAYLEDVQLIRSRMRMGELEYLFMHALVQEAAYESIPFKQRKQLHLRVAESIERIFRYRLHEFYGILAYHYGRAESLEKTEDYLIKAGEEALRSSASNEALSYYQEALSVYRALRDDSTDPEKVAILEKNIGLALFNRGRYAEAEEHFDKALNYYWGELPKNSLSTTFRFLLSFIKFLLALYFPLRWFKRVPTQNDIETIELFYKKGQAQVIIDPKRFFIEFFFFQATLVNFDLTKFKFGIAMFAGASALFSFTGLSFSIARRVLNYAKPRLGVDDAKQLIIYNLLDTQHLFLRGQWNDLTEYSEDLVGYLLAIGEVWEVALHYYWHGLPKIFQGHFDAAKLIVTKLNEIAEDYENNIYRLLKYLLNIYLLIECRDINEAAAELNRGIDLAQNEGWGLSILNMYSLKASIDLLMKNMEEAGKSLDQANQISSEVKAAPIQLSGFYRSQFAYHLRHLEDSLVNGYKEEASEHRRNAFKSGKTLIKTCQKAALYRTESYRLMGVYKWLIHDQKGASKWWQKAISEGERLGALPQLSRTYAEMGMRYSGIEGEMSSSDVNTSKELLQNAKTMFRDLRLRHDLEDLNLVVSRVSPGSFEI
ncbi:MAG: AAA family ATPase [Deltaproteobacteria bacterium]|nr:AAA family ATPase [Deltaproteobacteria bacterium]